MLFFYFLSFPVRYNCVLFLNTYVKTNKHFVYIYIYFLLYSIMQRTFDFFFALLKPTVCTPLLYVTGCPNQKEIPRSSSQKCVHCGHSPRPDRNRSKPVFLFVKTSSFTHENPPQKSVLGLVLVCIMT